MSTSYTQEELKQAFDIVTQHMRDWKAPICAEVDVAHAELGRMVNLIKAAVMHFTATEATVYHLGTYGEQPNTLHALRVEAKGYRMGPAGDH